MAWCGFFASNEPAVKQDMQVVEMNVRMYTPGCEKNIRSALSRLKGVQNVDVDLNMNKVIVVGFVDGKKVLKAVRGTGKRAELWHYQEPYLNFSYRGYNISPQAYSNTYNYKVHGYNNITLEEHNIFAPNGNDDAIHVFSDENPNSCSLM